MSSADLSAVLPHPRGVSQAAPAGAPGADRRAGALCRAHCEDHYCWMHGGHRGLHEIPEGELLSTGGRRFGNLRPAGWHQDDDLAADRAAYDARARLLSRTAIGRLRDLWGSQTAAGGVPIAGGAGVMSKDELVRALLRREFPGEDRCDPEHCRWPAAGHSPFCVPGTR